MFPRPTSHYTDGPRPLYMPPGYRRHLGQLETRHNAAWRAARERLRVRHSFRYAKARMRRRAWRKGLFARLRRLPKDAQDRIRHFLR